MHDIIIVGGGVSGCYLASMLKAKYDVLLIERSKKIVPKDSGIVSANFMNFFPSARKLIKSDITEMECLSPSGVSFKLQSDKPYAHILKREEFARRARKLAAKRAEIIYDNARDITHNRDFSSVTTSQGTFHGKLIVGCDGANSVVRRSAGIEDPRLALGMMVKTKQKLEGGITVHFNKYFSPDFFSWVIPQNNEYGMMTAVRPHAYFAHFAQSMYLPHGKMYAYAIPFTYTKSYANRLLLVGDACGQNKPLTGGGIMFSLTGAQHAARVINDAPNDTFGGKYLSFYERYWKNDVAWEIEKQFLMRLIYRKMTNAEIDEMFTKFGPMFSTLVDFDYDRLGREWGHFGKLRFAKFMLTKIPRILT